MDELKLKGEVAQFWRKWLSMNLVSQVQLGKALGVTTKTVNSICTGRTQPSWRTEKRFEMYREVFEKRRLRALQAVERERKKHVVLREENDQREEFVDLPKSLRKYV